MKIDVCGVKDRLILDRGDHLQLHFSLWDRGGRGQDGGYRFGEIEITHEHGALRVLVRGHKRTLRHVKLEKQEEVK